MRFDFKFISRNNSTESLWANRTTCLAVLNGFFIDYYLHCSILFPCSPWVFKMQAASFYRRLLQKKWSQILCKGREWGFPCPGGGSPVWAVLLSLSNHSFFSRRWCTWKSFGIARYFWKIMSPERVFKVMLSWFTLRTLAGLLLFF